MKVGLALNRVGVLVSGDGSNLQAIIDAIEEGTIGDTCICAIISDNSGAYALERGNKKGIPAFCVDKKMSNKEEFHKKVETILAEQKADCLVLAGYLSFVSQTLTNRYKNRIINIHPSLIPSFCGKGFYGMKVHEAVIRSGVKFTGVTVHFVDESIDGGPILLQKIVPVSFSDTARTLKDKVLEIEHMAMVEAVKILVENNYEIEGKRVFVKGNSDENIDCR